MFHKLNVDEIRDPLDSFSAYFRHLIVVAPHVVAPLLRTETFNEFFYRKLKLDVRPVEDPDDPYHLVSGADCRLMVSETVSEATRLWIKGRDFYVDWLLGEMYCMEATCMSTGHCTPSGWLHRIEKTGLYEAEADTPSLWHPCNLVLEHETYAGAPC